MFCRRRGGLPGPQHPALDAGLERYIVAPGLGDDAAAWGSYYDTQPIVVAGRIQLGLDRMSRQA